MPSADTFSIPPIGQFVRRHLEGLTRTVDPFARNSRLCTHRNDLNPETAAEWHLEAIEFLSLMADRGETFDAAVIDPPYSPRQIKECYDGIGRKMQQTDALRAAFMLKLKDQLVLSLRPGGVVLTFGWNSTGMGKEMEFRLEEIMLVCHGADHNDTICLAERYDPHPTLFGNLP